MAATEEVGPPPPSRAVSRPRTIHSDAHLIRVSSDSRRSKGNGSAIDRPFFFMTFVASSVKALLLATRQGQGFADWRLRRVV
eukprot:7418616-Pyramimonas_sp.AAC.1